MTIVFSCGRTFYIGKVMEARTKSFFTAIVQFTRIVTNLIFILDNAEKLIIKIVYSTFLKDIPELYYLLVEKFFGQFVQEICWRNYF